MMSALIFSFIVSVLIIFSLIDLEEPQQPADILIKLPNGPIRGRRSYTTTNRPYWAFQKIPFATPPVGKLRFKPPLPAKNWEGVLDATKNDVICYQVPSNSQLESEDCLYINVYTPRYPNELLNWSLPVMFYIYGGGFVEGNCLDHIYGPEFLLDRDVIVVAANYRVGPFGFLSTQDMVVPGNNGLKDQLLALKWTRDNIRLFGGDSSKITIFGQSAGSASVTYHMLHLQSEGLFRGAICESGSFLCPWAYQRRSREYAFKTAAYIDETFASRNDSEALLELLQSVSAEELDEASYRLSLSEDHKNRQISQGFFFAPVIEPDHDGAFLTRKMYEQLKNGDFVKVPTLIGINSEENVFYAYLPQWLKQAMATYDNNLDWLVPDDMQINVVEKRKQVGREIRSIYTDGEDLAENLASAVRYYSDNSFTRPIIKHAELQSKFTDVYFYQFSYDGKLGNFSFSIEGADNVTHGEENKYLWRMYDPYYDNSDLEKFPLDDRITQNRIQQIWTDFAKYLNPTPSRLQNIKWPKVNVRDFPYVDIMKDLEIKYHQVSKIKHILAGLRFMTV